MAKGRRPKEGAQRRGGTKPETAVIVADPLGALVIPECIQISPLAAECWEWIVSGGQRYRNEDIPLLVELAEWWAISRQCSANIVSASGAVSTMVETPLGHKAHPDIRTKALATTHIRHLSGELGLGPLARMRMGLMDATTKSITIDIADRVEQAIAQRKALGG